MTTDHGFIEVDAGAVPAPSGASNAARCVPGSVPSDVRKFFKICRSHCLYPETGRGQTPHHLAHARFQATACMELLQAAGKHGMRIHDQSPLMPFVAGEELCWGVAASATSVRRHGRRPKSSTAHGVTMVPVLDAGGSDAADAGLLEMQSRAGIDIRCVLFATLQGNLRLRFWRGPYGY